MSARSANTSTHIIAALIDGQPHKLSDIYDFIASSIDPQIATRYYISAHLRNNKNPHDTIMAKMEYAVSKGKQRAIMSCLWHMTKRGLITSSDKPTKMNSTLQLTQLGKDSALTPKRGNAIPISLWKLLCREVRRGGTLSFTPAPR